MVTRAQLRKLRIAEESAATIENRQLAEMWLESIRAKVLRDDSRLMDFMGRLERPPISIEEFLDSPEFMGSTDLELWPEVRAALIKLNSDWWKEGAYNDGCFAGATRSAKSTIAQITLIYRLYLLSCLKSPQQAYGLPSATQIVFAIFGAKPNVTKKVVYLPIRKWVEKMPYFQKHMPVDPLIESEMIFREKNIRVAPAGADIDAVLGSALIFFIADEINFMQVISKSKRAEVTQGRAGVYDQATNLYETAVRRVNGTFGSSGPSIAMSIASSSTRYKGDFTDKRMAQVKQFNQKRTFVYCPKQYEVRPQKFYCGQTFRLLVGNEVLNDTRILREGEVTPEGAMVLDVPIEYEDDFNRDIHNALRDIVGISNSSVSPFIRQRWKVYKCVENGKEAGLESFLVKDNVLLGVDGMPMVKRGHYCKNPSRPRYVHIDLALTGDRVGISMLRYDGVKSCARGGGVVEKLPMVAVEMACSIEPDSANEIDIAEVRAWVRSLKDSYGYPIKAVTYDGFSSIESIQQWRKQGMKSGQQSVDRTSTPYKQFRDAINDERILLPDNEILLDELFNLEHDTVNDKVDHPASSGKDVADSCCGAFTTLIERRSSWVDSMEDDEASDDLRAPDMDRYDEERPV